MIRLVQGIDKMQHYQLITSMHQLRAQVFNDRLGWAVNVVNGQEIDDFDTANPLYLISVDSKNTLKGALRLLPTTGPNMLRDVFPQLLIGHDEVRSPLIWESTRFCVSKEAALERSSNQLNYQLQH